MDRVFQDIIQTMRAFKSPQFKLFLPHSEPNDPEYDLDAPLPRTYTDDKRFGPAGRSPKSPRSPTKPSHKRAMSDLSHSPLYNRLEQVRTDFESSKTAETNRSKGGKRHVASTPKNEVGQTYTDEEASESEELIRTIIRQRVSQWTTIVEETPSDQEEDSDEEPVKTSSKALESLISAFKRNKRTEIEAERERRNRIKRQLLTILDDFQGKETVKTSAESKVLDSSEESLSRAALTDLDNATEGNSTVIRTILEAVCLPGELFRKQRELVLEAISVYPVAGHFAILLSSTFPQNQFCGVYHVDRVKGRMKKVSGSVFNPATVYFQAIAVCYSFSHNSNDFVETKAANEFDAFQLKD